MPRYTLSVLGLEVSFRTDADHERITKAKELIEDRYQSLAGSGNNISKEKVLICLALSLADDFMESEVKLKQLENKIGVLLEKS